jgi:RsmE family RNA methyltransferase
VNLLLLEPEELAGGPELWLDGRRGRHLLEVLRVTPGRVLRAGVIGGPRGTAQVLETGRLSVRLRFAAADEASESEGALEGFELLLALPRPKVLRRLLRSVASLGVRRLRLLNAWRVDKSYFESPVLQPAALRHELILGCEQGGHTRLPEVAVERLLRPFWETLPPVEPGELRLVCEPGAPGLERHAGRPERRSVCLTARYRADASSARSGKGAYREYVTDERRSDATQIVDFATEGKPVGALGLGMGLRAALGPEGGWVERELESWRGLGFFPVSLSPHTLTSETAVLVLIGQLELLAKMTRTSVDVAL